MNGMSLNGYVNFHLYVLNGESLIRWFRWWAVVFFYLLCSSILILTLEKKKPVSEPTKCMLYIQICQMHFLCWILVIFFSFFSFFAFFIYKRLFKIVNIVVQIIFYSNQFHVFRIIIFWSFNISNLIFCVKIKFSN